MASKARSFTSPAGTFRYRLAADVPELARHFCARACEQHGLPRLELSRGALRAIEAAEWPGNVRQLEHAVEAGAIRAAGLGSALVERQHLFAEEAGGALSEEGEAATDGCFAGRISPASLSAPRRTHVA